MTGPHQADGDSGNESGSGDEDEDDESDDEEDNNIVGVIRKEDAERMMDEHNSRDGQGGGSGLGVVAPPPLGGAARDAAETAHGNDDGTSTIATSSANSAVTNESIQSGLEIARNMGKKHGMMVGEDEWKTQVSIQATRLFHVKKFFMGEEDLEYKGKLYEKMMDKLDPDRKTKPLIHNRREFWNKHKDNIRKVVEGKRSAVGTEIKKAFCSKWGSRRDIAISEDMPLTVCCCRRLFLYVLLFYFKLLQHSGWKGGCLAWTI